MRPADLFRGVYDLRPRDRERLALGIDHVMRLGPRPLAELLIEITDDVPHLLRALDDLRRLPPEVVQSIGGRDWMKPIRAAIRGRRAA